MSVLLGVLFACLGVLAIAALMASWRQFAPLFAEVRDTLQGPPLSDEVRLTVQEHVFVAARPRRHPLRHMHRPKPVMHRLHGRTIRRAIA